MFRRFVPIFLVALIGSAVSHAEVKEPKQIREEARSRIEEISIEDLADRLAAGDKCLLIDVRTEKEFLGGHIAGALWIPRGKAEFAIQAITKDPEQEVVLYCRTGTRSALVASALQDIGFRRVVSLEGGFRDWVNAGHSFFNLHGELKVVEFEKEEVREEM